MEKSDEQFGRWGVFKKSINRREWQNYIHEGEIWFCSIGMNVGFEEDGKNNYFERPVLVLRKLAHRYFWGIPLTSKRRAGFYMMPVVIRGKEVSALLMQMRVFDCQRLQRKLAVLPPTELFFIKQAVSDILWKNKRPQLAPGPRKHSS